MMQPPRKLIDKSQLSPREKEVTMLAAQGKTYADISVLLGISEDTAKSHIAKVRRKLCATNKTHAIAIALSKGLIEI